MTNKVELQPAYLLHSRPYRETSALLDFHTRDHGRMSLIAKGIRHPNSRLRALIQPFSPLFVSWSGRSSLKTLTAAEANGNPVPLKGEALFSALYLNELLCRLLHHNEGDEVLFSLYTDTLLRLSGESLEPVLRQFELDLLEFLGYGISFEFDAHTGEPVNAEGEYAFDQLSGFSVPGFDRNSHPICTGKDLLRIAGRDFSDEQVRKTAKLINRIRLAALLGDKPLKSRRLFTAGRRSG